jgi:hypothetical protein
LTTLRATDINLVTGTSGNYTVRAVKLIIPDSTILSARTFLMPVLIRLAGDPPPAPPQQLAASLPTGGPLCPRLYWSQQSRQSYNVYRSASSPFHIGDVGVTSFMNVGDELPGDTTVFCFTDSSLNLTTTPKMFYAATASWMGAVRLFSGQFRISWSSSMLTLTGIQRAGTLTESLLFQSEIQPSYGDVSFSGQQSLPGNGVLFYLQFYVIPGGSGSTNLTMSNALFNEDQLAIYDQGTVNRTAAPTITVSPTNPQETVAGDSIQFTVSGGSSPYSWFVTNPAAGTVSSAGRFRAQAGGLTYVWVQDANGFTDSSALITVDDFRIVAQSLTAARGDSATIALQLVGTATGLGIYSVELMTTVSGTGWAFAYPSPTGTLLNGWSSAFETNGSAIRVAASNGEPLAGSGVLLQLRGRVAPTAPTGDHTISLDFVNLNEGNRRAFRVNGTLTVQ